jgi:two-component system chemotaxis response regulator CheB
MIAIGASTGGISSLEYILKHLGDNIKVPLLIVQHVPKYFMEPLLTYLSKSTKLNVQIPQHGLRIEPGNVYVAPAGAHFKVHKTGNIFTPFIDILGEPVAGFKPSIDSLFYSVAISAGGSSVAVILSGMGIDGVKGIKAIHKAGGLTIAQSPESSRVPGIILSALREKAINKIVPLSGIPTILSQALA